MAASAGATCGQLCAMAGNGVAAVANGLAGNGLSYFKKLSPQLCLWLWLNGWQWLAYLILLQWRKLSMAWPIYFVGSSSCNILSCEIS